VPRIAMLSSEVADQIAAGEVVERVTVLAVHVRPSCWLTTQVDAREGREVARRVVEVAPPPDVVGG